MNLTQDVKAKEQYQKLIIYVLVFVGFLALAPILRNLLESSFADDRYSRLLAGIISRALFLIPCCWYILSVMPFSVIGLNKRNRPVNWQAVVLPMIIILPVLFGNMSLFSSSPVELVVWFLINNLLVAVVEEVVFRGLFLPRLVLLFKERSGTLILAVTISATVFGLIHYLNLIRQPNNFSGITSQVIFAISIGIFLGGLYLRTEHIILPILIHFLINITFGNDILKSEPVLHEATEKAESTDWASLILTMSIFLFIAAGGIFMSKWSNKDRIVELFLKTTKST